MDKTSRNIEIKAKVLNPEHFINKVNIISNSEGKEFSQVDVFFNVANGRLKLRKEKDDYCLIFYDRPDTDGPKLSKFNKCYVSDGEGLQTTLIAALGIKGVVKKLRRLFLIGQTRVHLDNVDGLGNFMELEVKFKTLNLIYFTQYV
uniref:CYTH domain-containing protein n=1 Tax=Clastoptera arizonana TaxID=38151 RepID=A0A1B6DSD7_9HEMI